MKLLLLIPLLLSGCTTVRENGRVVFSTSSDIRGLHFRTPAGTVLDVEDLSNSKVHKTIGVNIIQGATSVGTAIATSGIIR